MKFQAKVGDDEHQIEIKRDGNRVFAKVDDREYELEATQPEPNVFLFKNGGKITEVFVEKTESTSLRTHTKGRSLDVNIVDPKKLPLAGGSDLSASGKAEIKTAMPGKVVKLLLNIGDEVKKGDGVMIVEAMKMQNELRSPTDGSVVEIKVAEGATVAAGDILAVIE